MPRPLSHDLMRTLLESLSAKLEQIIIHDIKDSTFFAKLIVRTNGEVQEIDARPSDGIALALRMQAPIFVSDKIALEETVPDKAGDDRRPHQVQEVHRRAQAVGLFRLTAACRRARQREYLAAERPNIGAQWT